MPFGDRSPLDISDDPTKSMYIMNRTPNNFPL